MLKRYRKIKEIFKGKKLFEHFSWLVPRQHHLNGTLLHRIVGERLFEPKIWKPTKTSIACGLAVGVFVALTPTMGVQMFLAVIVAYFLQVNIPAAVAACWITNPFTAPIIYTLQYKLGIWLSGIPEKEELAGYRGMLKHFVQYAKPLWVGSLISAAFFSAFIYAVVFIVWGLIRKLTKK
ncbi:MAG: DUF2062 domain-containing protein [Candidatus Brocadia sp.]